MLDIKLEKKLPVVQMNFEEVKASLISGASKYKGIIVTEESLKDCKSMQKELSKTRRSLDTYRKGIKKEMLIPITNFEGECKELIGLVEEVEEPIKSAIKIFDDKVREKKRLQATEFIKENIVNLKLGDKYAEKLTVLDEYAGLSISIKKIREDIERRSLLLKQEQKQDVENLQIIKNDIENANKIIDAKLDIKDFQSLIDTEVPISQILSTINERAERIKSNEEKAIANRKAKAEKEVLDRIAKAEKEAAEKVRIEERNIRIAKEAVAEKIMIEEAKIRLTKEEKEHNEHVRLNAIEEAKQHKHDLEIKAIKDEENKVAEKLKRETELKEASKPKHEKIEKKYFIEMKVTDMNIEEVKALSEFLKDHEYIYVATKKGKCK